MESGCSGAMRSGHILGISAYYHDSAAALLSNGYIRSAAQEERFSRKKHDAGFPRHAIEWCLAEAGIRLTDLDCVVFYDKPFVKFERLLETYLGYAPSGLRSFVASMPIWLTDKLYLKASLRRELCAVGNIKNEQLPPLLFTEHHQAHAASAFYPSPYYDAAVLCLDGVGEWATSSVWKGQGTDLTALWELDFPHSLGLLYSAFTYYTGFKVNSGEYKLMGLAPYGEPRYLQAILDNLIDLKADGTYRLNMDYFSFCTGLTMTSRRFHDLFGGPPRAAESEVTQKQMDIAASIQALTEEVVLRLGRTVHSETGERNLCLAGGVALNCVANGRLLREGPFDGIWIQPAAGDAGGAVGAAFIAWYERSGQPRGAAACSDGMRGSYLGPCFSTEQITCSLNALGASYTEMDDGDLMPRLAQILADEHVVGWFQGRMEFGPRALGGRSIIGDPRSPKMQTIMNLKVKYRESFRPFAPSVLAEDAAKYFELDGDSPYMLLVAPIREEHRIPMTEAQQQLFGIEKLNVKRSELPAITHVDYSARIQTVHRATNPRYYELLSEFKRQTGCSVLVNTSFNVRGEPIVCTPEDAYRCFMRTEMDFLVIENFLLAKSKQSLVEQNESWMHEFELD
jgi:carbamoyltransferase